MKDSRPADRALRSDRYFAGDRSDLLDWVGGRHARVLEIGCGAGGNAAWLRRHGASRIVGIDLDRRSVEAARAVFDAVLLGRVEDVLQLADETFDLVVCADVLEHLEDPEGTVRSLAQHIGPGGILAASIPNIRHYRALGRIAFGRGFAPDPEGVFDGTHLRFFTRANVAETLRRAGLEPDRWGSSPPRRMRRIRGLVTKGPISEYLTYQWFVVAHPRVSSR